MKREVEPFYRPLDEKTLLRPLLERLSDKLCQTVPYILTALKESGLTVVLLEPRDFSVPTALLPPGTEGAR